MTRRRHPEAYLIDPEGINQGAGLAIYVARGLRSGSTETTEVTFTACGGWDFFSKNEMRKLDIFQVASNVSLVAEVGCAGRA